MACSVDSQMIDYREEMRRWIIHISEYAQKTNPKFLVIPQNGHELLTLDGTPQGEISQDYVEAISGLGREDLNYGYTGEGIKTPDADRESMYQYLIRASHLGKKILVTDYVKNQDQVRDACNRNTQDGFLCFATPFRGLNKILSEDELPVGQAEYSVASLDVAKNFLYLLNMSDYPDRQEFIQLISNTNYDLIVTDMYYNDGVAWTQEEVRKLKQKPNGNRRLLIAYMSIGEAEDYRSYWKQSWSSKKPKWLGDENPDWAGNYKVKYWDPEWQSLFTGSPDAYLDKIVALGFDGVYLDLVDAFWYFENAES